MFLKDRTEAGQLLAEKLKKYRQNAVVLALPRGGVVVAAEIAKILHLLLDLIIARKIGHPYNSEYAIAAISENGDFVANQAEIVSIDRDWFEKEKARQIEEARHRRKLYLKDRKPITLKDKTVIIVDDGLATGLSMRAAILQIKKQKPKKIVIAVPVAPKDTATNLSQDVDDFVALDIPENFKGAVGAYYQDFNQVSDEEVIGIINNVNKTR